MPRFVCVSINFSGKLGQQLMFLLVLIGLIGVDKATHLALL